MGTEIEQLLPQTEQALIAFYNSPDSVARQVAHKWLLDLQNSEKGWQLCWKLLSLEKPVEVQYFGSCMLHYKISKCWSELPDEHYMSLKDQIISFICQFSKGPKIVVSKLCLALASFLIHALPDFWSGGCEMSISELQAKLSVTDGANFIVLEYMTLLPEEFSAATLIGNKRVAARSQLEQFIPKLLEILQSTLESAGSTAVYNSSLKCLASWIQFGVSILDCQKLLPSILNKFHDESLIEVISSVLVELISHPSSFNQENSVYAFLEHLDGFENILKKAIPEQNFDTVSQICKVLVSIGETHSRLLRQASTDDQQKHCLQLLRLILDCTGIPGNYPVDETCSELTFNFWYTFQDELLALHPENVTNYHFYLRESFVALIQILFNKVQFPDGKIYKGYGSEEREMFRCYRQDVQDTIMYVCSLLREQCLHHLTELLKFLLSGEKSRKWQEIEAALYLLQGTSEYIQSDEDTCIPVVVSLLPSLPSHPKIMESAVFMIGSFSEWLSCHPDQLSSVIPLLQNGIKQPELITASTLSLRDICRESSRSLSPAIGLDLVSTCLDAAKSNGMNAKERLRCIECIGYILSSLPLSTAEEHEKPTLCFLSDFLQNSMKFSQIDSSAIAQIQHGINCYTAFFRSFDPSENADSKYHPLLTSYTKFLDQVKILMSVELCENLVQDVVAAIHRAVDTIRDPFLKVLSDTSQVILELFCRVPCGSILEVSGTIIGMLGSVDDARQMITEFFKTLLTECLNFMESEKAKESPDTVHGFMVLLNRTIKTAPSLLLENQELHIRAIRCALQFLGCQETPTIKTTVNFFTTYINSSVQHEKAIEMLDLFGQDLVVNVLACIGGHGPRSNVDLFSEIILALNKNYITKSSTWLQNALSQENYPSKLVAIAQKDNFRKMITREKSSKRRIKEIVREFSLICRGLDGMAYAT